MSGSEQDLTVDVTELIEAGHPLPFSHAPLSDRCRLIAAVLHPDAPLVRILNDAADALDTGTPGDLVHVGWRNTRTHQFHPLKLDIHPETWWVKVYCRTSEVGAGKAAYRERRRSNRQEAVSEEDG